MYLVVYNILVFRRNRCATELGEIKHALFIYIDLEISMVLPLLPTIVHGGRALITHLY